MSALAGSRRATDISALSRILSGLHLDGLLLLGIAVTMCIGMLAIWSRRYPCTNRPCHKCIPGSGQIIQRHCCA